MTLPFSRFSEYFLVVAKTGSLRKAADQLFISVSAIHRQIVLAEEQLDVKLFERLPNGLKMTLAGELLYTDLLRWEKEFQKTLIRFDEIQGLQRGTIKIGLITALNQGVIVQEIDLFQKEYPWITLEITIDTSETIAEKIINMDLDFGILLDPIQHTHLDVLSFVDVPLGFVFSPQHVLAQEKKLNLFKTVDTRHIICMPPLVISDRIEAFYKKRNFIPQQKTYCSDINLIINILKKKSDVSILSYLDAYMAHQEKDLIFYPIEDKDIRPLILAVCTAPKRQLSRAAQTLMQRILVQLDSFLLPPNEK